MKRLRAFWRRFSQGYVRFVERQGFAIILGVCVAVIAATAIWTRQERNQAQPAPTLPADGALSAAEMMQESLKDVATPTPGPTVSPQTYDPPLQQVSVLTDFDGARLAQSGVTGVWRLHDAVDLAAEAGAQVLAMSDGTVLDVHSRGVQGASVLIAHSPSITALYAGMTSVAGLAVGDPVAAGQVIGFAGNGMLDESDLPVHLHLRVTRDGVAIDPTLLWR